MSIPGEAEWVEYLSGKEKVTALLEGIQDEASAEAALPEIEKAVELQKAHYQQAVRPGGFTYPQIEALLEKHRARFQEIEKRFPAALSSAKTKAPTTAEKLDGFMTQLGYRWEAPPAPPSTAPPLPRS
jgi:hypothetical protein